MRIENTAGWVDVGLKVPGDRWSRWDEIREVQLAIGWADHSPTISARDAGMVALELAQGPEGTGKSPGTEAVDNGRGSIDTGVAWLPVARAAASDVVTAMTRSVAYWAVAADGLRPVLQHRDEVIEVRSTVYPPDSAAGPLRIKVRAWATPATAGKSTRATGIVTVRSATGALLEQYWALVNGKRRHDRAADRRAAEAARKAARTPEQVEADRAVGRARDAARRAARTPEQVEADVARRKGNRADARLRAAAVSSGGLAAGAAD